MANIREKSLEPREANSSGIAAVGAFVVRSWYQVEIPSQQVLGFLPRGLPRSLTQPPKGPSPLCFS